MIERIELFAPSLLVASIVAILCYFYLKISPKPSRFDSAIGYLVLVPIVEELFFRAPLLILFDRLSLFTWVGIIASAFAFALLHLLVIKKARLKSAGFALLFGIITGFSVVYFQSLWVGVVIHSAWNIDTAISEIRLFSKKATFEA